MTDRPGLPEVDGYGGPITRDEVATLLEQAYDAGRLHANDEIIALRKLRDAVEHYLDGSGRIRISELWKICNECKQFKKVKQ